MTALLLLFGWLCACQTAEFPAPIRGTTYRIGQDVPAQGSEIRIDVLGSWDECAEAKVLDMDACLPWADRASGELHFSFILRDPELQSELARALTADQVTVSYDSSPQNDFQLVPHEPVATGQLYIVLIDGSASMFEKDGDKIRKVYSALLKPSVLDAFFPDPNAKTGVVLLRFSETFTGLDGGPPRVLRDRKEYKDAVQKYLLNRTGGYTRLYDAIKYTMTDLLQSNAIQQFLATRIAQPSIVVVTDGFNNERADDTCADNAPRLQSLVDLIREVRTSQNGATRPTLFTVGLGLPFRRGGKPSGLNRRVTPTDLCGKYESYRIDGVLDQNGIDHVSMQWIAEAGAGKSFVKRKATGLDQVLEVAAATRYRWYEVWFRVPEAFYHRRSFDVQLSFNGIDRAQTEFQVHPGGWLDAPTATRVEGERWHHPTSFRHTFTVLMPALGLLVLLVYVGPAVFNTRRALFRRARPRR
ncbi:MAG: VWA domain-containing protein [Myxococcota bacterium]